MLPSNAFTPILDALGGGPSPAANESITATLMAVRSLFDIRRMVLPVLRREVGLSGIAIVVNRMGREEWLIHADPEARSILREATDVVALDAGACAASVVEVLLGDVAARLLFVPAPSTPSQQATAVIGRLTPSITAAIRNVLEFEALYRSAVTDPLTGLYNRRFFDSALERVLATARRMARSVSLIAIDLDGFKALNDQLGHQAGDVALGHIADVLRSTTRAADIVARTGGDEFMVLTPFADLARAQVLADRILRRIQGRAVAEGFPQLGASIGIAASPPWPPDAAELVEAADRAMYRAKHRGKGRIALVDWDFAPPSGGATTLSAAVPPR
jgi:diguanylate cyclase (GGDEF)-like protein